LARAAKPRHISPSQIRRTGQHGRVPEDDDQLAALRRLRVAFGPIEVVDVISHDPIAAPDESGGRRGG
jgi:hypothetical protein